MKEINAQDLKSILSNDGVTVVDFWAPWCPTCRMMMPNIENIEVEYEGKVNFYKLNVVDNDEFAKSINVSTLPTLIFYKDGTEVERTTGFKQKVQINAILKELI